MSENSEKKDLVIAKVGNKEIKNSEFGQFLQAIDPNVVKHFMGQPDGFNTILEEMINQELMFNLAKEENYENDEEFKETLELTKNNLLKSYAYGKIIGSVVDPTEEEAKKYFDEHKADFKKPFVNASHILLDNETDAEEALKRLEKESFEDVAKDVSTCPSRENGGNLGDFTKGQMVKEFDEAVFSMKEGEVKGPIKTQFGFHIIKLNKINSVQEPNFEVEKNAIISELKREKQLKVYQDTVKNLKEKYKVEILV